MQISSVGILCTSRLCRIDSLHITCYRLYDVLELGVERYQGIKDFTQAAKLVQLGNKVSLSDLQAAVLRSLAGSSCTALSRHQQHNLVMWRPRQPSSHWQPSCYS